MKIDFYSNKYNNNADFIKKLAATSQKLSTMRMLSFIAIILAFALWYDTKQFIFYFAGMIAAILFLILLYRHSILHRQQHQAENLQRVLASYLARFNHEWKTFGDTGYEFLERQLPQDTDLHIFGAGSIFQYCCCARTKDGRQLLAERLRPEPISSEELALRQASVSYFTENRDFSLQLQTHSQDISHNHSFNSLIDYIGNPLPLANGFTRVMYYCLPVITALSIILALLEVTTYKLTSFFVIIQLSISLSKMTKTNRQLSPLYHLNKEISCYHSLLNELAKNIGDKSIGKIDGTLIKKSLKPLKLLNLLTIMGELRNNALLLFLLNGIMLWDILLLDLFGIWMKHNGHQLSAWINQWNETEVSISLAIPGQTREAVVLPKLTNTATPYINAQELYHPLLPEASAVPNSIELSPSLNIITGSNMSGKTTFLRTLALSCIMAYAGSHICSKSFILSPMQIMSSIRVNDNLSEGISSFYAELLRIKTLINYSRENKPMLAVIDEIFKGTNSADRIIGAEKTLRKMMTPQVIALVSTHDFELCNISSEEAIPTSNYHFQESYSNDSIKFDYIMRPGPCKTTNAKYLLKLIGIE